jgi:hypothetical protein
MPRKTDEFSSRTLQCTRNCVFAACKTTLPSRFHISERVIGASSVRWRFGEGDSSDDMVAEDKGEVIGSEPRWLKTVLVQFQKFTPHRPLRVKSGSGNMA